MGYVPFEEKELARRFHTDDPGFAADFEAFLREPRGDAADVGAAVAAILADVRANGFDAVARLTADLDDHRIDRESVAVTPARIQAAWDACASEDLAALELAAARIRAYHERQRPKDHDFTDEAGVGLAWRWRPLDSVGLYVPGGRASYPSSLLMNAIPAQVAGVARVVVTAPTPGGVINPLVLAAARVAGVEDVYTVGGAQAVAALAFGADPIAPVDKIVGPGNAYVAEAKRQVFGLVGIDTIAGPSEILVLADAENDPAWIAADLLSQAEHDPAAQALLISDGADFADAVAAAIEAQLARLGAESVAAASWRDHGAIVVVGDLADEGVALANRVAAEHVEIAAAEAEALASRVRHAGAIFLGRHTPEALGDYVTGSNHVLPTAGAARFASGLSVLDFMKRTSLQRVTPEGLAAIGPAAARLARAEGLVAHAESVEARLARLNG